MKTDRISIESAFYVLALALALFLRLAGLGGSPLSDVEAGWALQALDVSQGVRAGLDSQPAYIFLTGLLFTLTGSSETAARVWPALAGASLCLWPVFLRRRIGRAAALILAFGLALDPGLVSISRQAGSPMLAVAFGLFALGFFSSGSSILAGVCAGLALLSGPAIWKGALALGLAWGVLRLLHRAGAAGTDGFDPERGSLYPSGGSIRRAGAVLVLTWLLAGTLFFRFPQGLGAWAASLPDYLAGWVTPGGVPALRLAAAILIYVPLAVLFGFAAGLRSWLSAGEKAGASLKALSGQFFSLWLLVALTLALFYPGRTMADLAWVLVPLWGLAAIGLQDQLSGGPEHKLTALGQASLVFVLLALVWLNLAGLANTGGEDSVLALRLGLLGGVIVLGALTTALVALGWSWDVARRGLLWGSLAALSLYLVSCAGRAALFHPAERPDIRELWSADPQVGDADLFLDTLDELTGWQSEFNTTIDILVALDSPSLRWALRDFKEARFLGAGEPLTRGAGLAGQELPAVVITRQDAEAPSLAAAYRGQDFTWWLHPSWNGALPSGFARWLVFRQTKVEPEAVVLWARSDTLPGGELVTGNENPVESLP